METEQTDASLKHYFAALREADRSNLPPLPAARDNTAQARTHKPASPSIASRAGLAACLLVAAGVLFTLWPAAEEDPAKLYAEVMRDYTLQTDLLLSTSSSLAPENTGVPQVFTPAFPEHPETLTN